MLARFGCCPYATMNKDFTSSPTITCCCRQQQQRCLIYFLPQFSFISFVRSVLFFFCFILFISVLQRQNKPNRKICRFCWLCLCVSHSSFNVYKHIAKCAICICYSNEFYARDEMVTTFIDTTILHVLHDKNCDDDGDGSGGYDDSDVDFYHRHNHCAEYYGIFHSH